MGTRDEQYKTLIKKTVFSYNEYSSMQFHRIDRFSRFFSYCAFTRKLLGGDESRV